MKRNSVIIQFALCLVLTMFGLSFVNGQTYQLGDLYTFQDGSKGIVFYINPDNPTSGTVAALRDLDGTYALWTGSKPQSLSSSGGLSINKIKDWECHGKRNTQLLAASGVSPAANAIGDSLAVAGWYIPDAMQLYYLRASAAYLNDAFESYGGNILSLWTSTHWSSTCVNNTSGNVYAIRYDMYLDRPSGTTAQYVRLVRDFPDTAEIRVFWADAPDKTDTLVSPDATTDYNAFVVNGFDSLSLTATVTVNQPAADTLREAVYASPQPYTSSVAPIFTTLDVSLPGFYEYNDTLHTVQGCDSIVTLLLTVGENVRYSDTLCPLKEDYYFAPLDTVFAVGTVSGVYEHHGTKLVDGLPVDTIAYYELTILPVYEQFDTIEWCLYELSETRQYEGNAHVSITVNGSSVTVTSNSEAVVVEEIAANTDFALRMQTTSGCDSVVFLHVDARRVMRDTVYADVLVTQVAGGQHTVACHTFTNIDDPGTYRATDTLTASNGCDSLVTVVLIVEPLHEETLCDSTLTVDLIWQSNLSDYIWNGQPLPAIVGTSGYYEFSGQRLVDGVLVDTVSYLQLVVNQSYKERDTVSFCMEEATYTAPYDDIDGVTISVAADGTVSVTAEMASGVEVTPVPGSTTDFALRMQTTSGCDSVVFLHVDARRVQRDTVRYTVFENQIENEHVTVSEHTFEGITTPGVYEIRDTLTAANGCDSVVIHELTVNPCVSDFSIVCPPNVYDTLAYGDCVMTIYPERLGTPMLLYDGEWPFRISSEIPEDNLFAQGDNIVVWTVTDLVCGYSDTCEQHVVIAFPQCPDAVDFEGNVYHGVRIGCDCWTQRNLESRRYSNGDDITGKYAYYSWQHPDTVANVGTYGRLYTFEAAVRDSADNGHNHIQGICPDGWFLPTPEHYERLNEYGTPSLRSPDLWVVGAGDNSTGFTALPAGYYNGTLNRFEGMLTETYFWSTKKVQESIAKCIYSVDYACDSVMKKYPMSGLGYSVRCVKEK